MNLPAVLIDHPDGEIRVRGSRISLYNIVMLHRNGHTPEMVANEFDTISLFAVKEVVSFYESNRIQVDAYVEAEAAELERQRAAASL